MSTIVDLDVTVDLIAFRRAVTAVLPNASTNPKEPRHNRVRMYVGTDYLAVVASDGYGAGLALAELQRHAGRLGCFDLSPGDTADISRLFKPPAKDTVMRLLRLEVTEKTLSATDVSGLFPGKSYSLPPAAMDEQFPDIARTLRLAQERAVTLSQTTARRELTWSVWGDQLRRFAAASQAYDAPVEVIPSGNHEALLGMIGGSYLGLATVDGELSGDSSRRSSQREAWRRQFADVTASHPLDLAAPVFDDSTVSLLDLMMNEPPPPPKRDDDAPVKPPRPAYRLSLADVPDHDEDQEQHDEDEVPEVESMPMFGDDEDGAS